MRLNFRVNQLSGKYSFHNICHTLASGLACEWCYNSCYMNKKLYLFMFICPLICPRHHIWSPKKASGGLRIAQ